MRNIAASIILVFFTNTVFSESISENLAWNKEFTNESVHGVFVLCKNSSSSCTTNNAARASAAYIPASTFKIPNALIGLETGVVKNEQQVFKWDGKPRDIEAMGKRLNATRRNASFCSSRISANCQRNWRSANAEIPNSFSYGNANIGGGIDKFWLEGQIRISAINQVMFLESLHLNSLPASKVNQLIVKETLVTEATPEYIVYSKTGYSGVGTEANPGIAWWIGWVEKGTDVYFFAFNMDINNESKLPTRKSIPKKIMANEGVVFGD